MLLGILSEQVAKSYPWISVESRSVATRLSVIDPMGAERVAGQIRVASEQLMPGRAIQEREVRAMRETSHRRDRLNPLQLADMHLYQPPTARS
ncbi:hypothetical protein GCM10007857_83760 [Bradyrhizobium iriomotense]|uniref:Uncharacterized protein n=1 Tax=Bradyrhizobium iriomotense TaxID=441950 RepID=A0ABQ6BHR6_9BRAD|nr:hypothetical protein GCM10007857_83760 [Bradyrhizobium iriomotense]